MVSDMKSPFKALALRASQAQLEDAVQASLHIGRTYDPSRFPVATPWGSSDLERIVWQDVFGEAARFVASREAAMRIPAIARARNLMVTTISRFPLVAMEHSGELDAEGRPVARRMPEQPAWLQSVGDGLSPQLRVGWSVDDLIFSGWTALWRNNNGDQLESIERIPLDEWETDEDGRVLVNGSVAGASDVILTPGLHEGILSYGRTTLDDITKLYENVRNRIANPVPGLELHQTGGEQMTDTEIDDLIDGWAAARRGANAGVAYTNEHIQLNELGLTADGQLMIESRNAAAVDCARLIGVHAGLLDATTPKSSLNYETATGRNQEFVDFDLALYMSPITARLSMPDVMPEAHQFLAFDLGDFTAPTPAATGPSLED